MVRDQAGRGVRQVAVEAVVVQVEARNDADRITVFRDNAEPASCVWLGRAHKLRRFSEYLQRKYGTPHPDSAALSPLVTQLPPPVNWSPQGETTIAAQIAAYNSLTVSVRFGNITFGNQSHTVKQTSW